MALSEEELVGIRGAIKETRRDVDETFPSLDREVKIGHWRDQTQSVLDAAVRIIAQKHNLPESDSHEIRDELESALRKVFEEEFGVDLW